MRTNKVTLQIDPRHWPWLTTHARRLGYASPVDYLNGILNMALIGELEANDESPPRTGTDEQNDLDDGIPF